MTRPRRAAGRGDLSPGTGARGFSLVEISIVLVIVGLLLRATLVPLATLRESGRERAARAQLDGVRTALLASVVGRGALPCPLPDGSVGPGTGSGTGTGSPFASPADAMSRSDAVPAGRCTRFRGGLPAAALALAGPVDAGGALLDPWGRALLYAVGDDDAATRGTSGAPDWTVPGEAAAVGIDALAATLTACRLAGRGACPPRDVRAAGLVFVVLSHGADPSAVDLQARNAGPFAAGDRTFTLAPRSTAEGHRFDDLLVWGAREEIVLWMLRAGVLP